MQVRASLGQVHRAIDLAVSLENQRAGRDTGDGGGSCVGESEEARQGPDCSLGAQVAPAPAAADLVYSLYCDLVYHSSLPDGP